MSVIIGYVFLGLSLAAPIGPINAAQLDKGIRAGFWHAWLVGVGAMFADVLYMVMVYLGVVHFLDNFYMKTFLWLFGSFVLIYAGVASLLKARDVMIESRSVQDTLFKSFLSGFFMSLSNPLTILFWLGIYGSVLANAAASYGRNELLLYSGAIVSGILLWDLVMAGIASTFRRLLTGGMLVAISAVSGMSLIGFGCYFGLEAYKLIFAGS
ncbi:LysE family transporter [Paenibacillus xerothermodurans]|uniref:Amino acid transporter n=1 Tax=Paenibacillus xerothermodurans TaxID=1977292 RepID=A0A2W1N8T2_PAEXE|nr:LysE family transporter [Paenibacillus xerothermodurans]PZE21029.1 amino acid transporter [Paenibacillus xerothermodurans]